MSKVNRAYPHLLGGVSEQPTEQRGAGQHWEQDNFVTDPVKGLVRRAGAELRANIQSAWASPVADMGPRTRTYDFQVGTNQLAVVYDTGVTGGVNRLSLINKSAGTLITVTHSGDANTLALLNGGITSAVAVGRFVLMTGPGMAPTYTTTERYGVAANLQNMVVWIRGGAYGRKFRMALVRGNQKLWIEYTTPTASYPTPLDTSALNTADPDYLKQVNDLTNQYNSNVNAWLATALTAAQPDSIAKQLAAEVTLSGFLATGETCVADGPSILLTASSVEDVEVDDGGDGSLARAVGNTVAAAELLSLFHVPGKIARVRPNNSTNGECFYMEAVSKDGSTASLTEVSWRETAGTRFTPTLVFGVLAVDDAGTVAHFNTDLAVLRVANANYSTLPSYVASDAGDLDSNAPQRFLGTPATMLTMFQDRVVIGCKNSINSSKTSDYFNFFRSSIVTLAADDPVSFVAIGGEDDIIRYALTYDRNLVVWGTGQYVIDGRKVFSPTTVSAVRMASIKDALNAAPILGDQYIFFGRSRDDGSGSIHHLQPGPIEESPETFELSKNLKRYLLGAPVEISVGNNPDYLYVRTAGDNSLKVYAYQDAANGERTLSAWSRWTFHPTAGELVGVSVYNGAVYLLFYSDTGTGVDVFLGKVTQTPGDAPYLDLWTTTATTVPPEYTAVETRSYGAGANYAGGNTASVGGVLYKGLPMTASVTLTSPWATDRDGLPIQTGRTVVNNMRVRMLDSTAMQFRLRANGWPDTTGGYSTQWSGSGGQAGACTVENFYDGLIPYSALSGNRLLFTIDTSEYGNTLDYTGYGGAGVNAIIRNVTPVVVKTMDFKFMVESNSVDDALAISLLDDTAAERVYFMPRREVNFDALQRAVAVVNGESFFLGSAALIINVWHRMVFTIIEGAGNTTWSLTRLDTGALVSAGAFANSNIPWNITQLKFRDDPILGSPPTRYADISLCPAPAPAPIPGAGAAVWDVTSGVAGSQVLQTGCATVGDGADFREGQLRWDVCQLNTPALDLPATAVISAVTATVPVGRETRDYRATLLSFGTGPLTISSIEWTGQLHYRARRL